MEAIQVQHLNRKVLKTNPKRILREKFRKRRANFIKKAHELKQICQAEVYVVIRRNDRYYTYTSTRHPQWPPPDSEIVDSGYPQYDYFANSY